jgi:hypothetical protein
MGKVVFATRDVSLHQRLGVGRQIGVVLSAGRTFPYDQLSDNLKKKLDNGGSVAGLEVIDESEAENRKNALVAQAAGINVPYQSTTSLPVTDDGSFSDHLVTDEVRTSNLAAQAESESGDPEPANVGRQTRKAVRGDDGGKEGESLADSDK